MHPCTPATTTQAYSGAPAFRGKMRAVLAAVPLNLDARMVIAQDYSFEPDAFIAAAHDPGSGVRAAADAVVEAT
jgi:hypothetical protein